MTKRILGVMVHLFLLNAMERRKNHIYMFLFYKLIYCIVRIKNLAQLDTVLVYFEKKFYLWSSNTIDEFIVNSPRALNFASYQLIMFLYISKKPYL
ncbi:MAG: hypothetical protein H6Q20_2023 [Bacteroidetes bacterium]|nr:hypothetical protein [Bacteroidota bacterium]